MSSPLLISIVVAVVLAIAFIYLSYIANKYWKPFDSSYAHPKTFYGEKFDKLSMKVNGRNFSSFVQLKYNDEGIHLRPLFPYSIFQKPVFVSWNEITEITKEKEIGQVQIKVGSDSFDNTVSFSSETYQKLESEFIKYKEYVKANL